MLPLEFEAEHTVMEIDLFRQEAFEMVERKALELESERTAWLAGVPVELRLLMSTVHGPLLNWLHKQIQSEDKLFPTRMQSGFQLTGELDSCGNYNTTPWQVNVNDEEASLDELKAARFETNLHILGKCEEREHNADLVTIGEQDCAEGCMTEAIIVDEELTRSVTLSRRIAVRELRSKGWRTRSVDHMSESGLVAATKPKDKIKHQTIDTMVFMILWLKHGVPRYFDVEARLSQGVSMHSHYARSPGVCLGDLQMGGPLPSSMPPGLPLWCSGKLLELAQNG